VCTSLICLADEVAGVYCVATIPEERGKGLGSHATAEPLRLVGKLGYRVAVLQSSRAGHSMYAKLGFAMWARYRCMSGRLDVRLKWLLSVCPLPVT
jgi:predicted acetyltransferase